jgi:uncharacterized protein with HEPN domain
MRTEAQRLGDIITAVDAIQRYLSGKDEHQFHADDMLQAAVHSKLVIIGEAITHLNPATTEPYTEVPWHQIRGFRNMVIHGYFKIDWQIVWGTATRDCLILRETCAKILADRYPHIDPEHL